MRRDGDIKVIGEDRMCFYVDPHTLEPRSCGCYDAWAHTDPEPPQISASEWQSRRNAQWRHAETTRKP